MERKGIEEREEGNRKRDEKENKARARKEKGGQRTRAAVFA